MAKISAKGCKELDRWTNKHGNLYVYRSDNTVLQKTKHRSYKIVFKNISPEQWARMTNKTAQAETAATSYRMQDVV